MSSLCIKEFIFFYLKDFIINNYNCKKYKLYNGRFTKKSLTHFDRITDKVFHRVASLEKFRIYIRIFAFNI